MFHGDHLIVPQTLQQINNFFLNYGHKIHLLSFIFSPEILAFELGNSKWKNCDFVDFSTEFTTSVICLHDQEDLKS